MAQSIDTLLSIDPDTLNKMSLKELKAAITIMNSSANKRINRMMKQGIISPALRERAQDKSKRKTVTESNFAQVKFSVKGVTTIQEARKAYKDVQHYLAPETKTSSLRGYKQVRNKTRKGLQDAIGEQVTITDKQMDRMFKAYDKVAEVYPGIVSDKRMKYGLMSYGMKQIRENKRVSTKTLIKRMMEQTKDYYEEYRQSEKPNNRSDLWGSEDI